MPETTFRVVFSGHALPGFDRDTAVANLAKLLKRTPEQVAASFNGKPSVIKKGLPEADAARYLQALKNAGLQVSSEAEQEPVAEKSGLSLSLADPDKFAAPAAPRNEKPVAAPPKISASLALVDDDEHKKEAEVTAGPKARMVCPACNHEQAKAEVCEACHVVIAKFLQRQAEKKLQEAERAKAAKNAPVEEEPATEDVPAKPSFFGKLFGKGKRV